MNENNEGPRGFAVLLQQVDDGALHAELSEVVQEATKKLSDLVDNGADSAKGTITLKLALHARRNGTITVEGDVTSKLPKMKRGGSVFWPTKGNNLSPENPKQQRLPLREVITPTTKLVELPPAEENVRAI